MAITSLASQSGNAETPSITNPNPITPAKEPPIQWVSDEEAEELNRILYKHFIRKKELKPGDNEKFIYRPIGLRPYVPSYHNGMAIITQTNQNLVMVSVAKFHRGEFETRKRREGGQEIEEHDNKRVPWTEYNRKAGVYDVVDPDANFDIDSRKFVELFKRDTE
jgi:hypothetical protein